jgi:hypothetical protein
MTLWPGGSPYVAPVQLRHPPGNKCAAERLIHAARGLFVAILIQPVFWVIMGYSMPTFALEPDERHIIASLMKENDRTVAIVGGSLLEARLEEKLKAQLRTDSSKDNQKILDDMFQGLGPLSSFSAKIRLGYLLQLYDYLVRIELTAIKDIRNRFAHEQTPITFDTPEIVTLVQKLKLIENHTRHISEFDEKKEGRTGVEYTVSPEAAYRTPRGRFISTFGMFTRVFSKRMGAKLDPVWGDGPPTPKP